MIKNKKVDVLYLIMGTNPFPNIVSVATRVKKNGKIICICTEFSKGDPFRRFKKVIEKKLPNIEVDFLIVDGYDRGDTERGVKESLENLIDNCSSEITIELNYTGGTKIMASSAYNAVKYFDYNSNRFDVFINLSYIDPEREVMYLESGRTGLDRFALETIKLVKFEPVIEYSLFDIFCTYNRNIVNEKKIKTEPEKEDLAKGFGKLFCTTDKKLYDKNIEFIRELNRQFKSMPSYKRKVPSYVSSLFVVNLESLIKKHRLNFKYKTVTDFDFKKSEDLFEYFRRSIWLEDFIFSIFMRLKDQGIIDDVVSNFEKRKNAIESDFEVDIVAYKKYKIFAISMTTSSRSEDITGKLFEVIQRAKDIAGDESGMCYINLCWDTDPLELKARNIWDNSNTKNLLIIGAKDFINLKEKISAWVTGGELNE